MSFEYSYSQFGPPDIHGVSNYVLELYDSTQNSVSSLIYIFDSMDKCYQQPGITTVMHYSPIIFH
jgi:hypothetical protein